MKAVADVLGVSRSNLHERLKGTTKPRRCYHKAQDAALLPLVTALVTALVAALVMYVPGVLLGERLAPLLAES